MKRLFTIIIILFATNIVTFAQDDVASPMEVEDTITDDYLFSRVTEFMGIPVDGTKREVIKKLKKKGFRNSYKVSGTLEGEFNGRKVRIAVGTYKKKVYRIMVEDIYTTDEINIKIKFNNLCYQFKNNNNYVPLRRFEDFIIPDDENIKYNMLINNKRYEAAFAQCFDNASFFNSYMFNFVWFIIYKEENKSEYKIVMYYDNRHNQADGDDL